MLIWSPPGVETFEEVVVKGYKVINALQSFGEEVSPSYVPAARKSQTISFDYSLSTFENLVRRGINKEGKTEFPDLGYTVNFFSSLDDDKSAGISMKLGNSNPKFSNTLVISLPFELEMNSNDVTTRLKTLFVSLIEILNPYWGAVVNAKNANRYDGYWKDNVPTTVHWLNFFGADIVKKIGMKRIEKVDWYRIQPLHDGYYLQLSDKPIQDNLIESAAKQTEVNKLIKL